MSRLARTGTALALLLTLHDVYYIGLCGTCRGLGYYLGAPGVVSDDSDVKPGARILLQARGLSGGLAQLEGSGTALPRLRVVTPAMKGFDDGDLASVLQLFSQTLARRQPFTLEWDLRQIAWPRISSSQYNVVREWVGDHVIAWDTHAQAHAIIITNPLARALTAIVLRAFRPPQPHRVCKDPAEALEFAATCCTTPRSWVKASYDDRDSRYSLLSALGLKAT